MPTKQKEMVTKLTNRYLELVNDPSFKSKVLELSYLESILMQQKDLACIEPVLFYQPSKGGGKLIYARHHFVERRNKLCVITKSLGPADKQPKHINQLSNDPLFMVKAQRLLRDEMLRRSDHEEYFIRYPHMF